MLNSSIAYNKQHGLVALALTEEDRARMERAGCAPADIERIESDEGSQGEDPEVEAE